MTEARDFIPTGNCVEQDAALFAGTLFTNTELDATQGELAKTACASCLQLPYCEQQRTAIGAVLYRQGAERPIVGGEVVAAEEASAFDLSQVMQFGEVTLDFERTPLPKDGQRALRSIQQHFRSAPTRVVGLKPIQHNTIDMSELVRDMLQTHDPELFTNLAPDVRMAVIREVGQHVLFHAAKRNPNGSLKKQHLRFVDFQPEDYYPFIRAFVAEAAAHAELLLPDPARRTTYHSLDFHIAYLEAGRQQQLSTTALHNGLVKRPTDPLRSALKRRDLQTQAKTRHTKRLREQRKMNQSGLDRPLHEVFAGYDQDIVDSIKTYFDYGVIAVDDTENPTVRLGKQFGDFHTIERQAILYAIGLETFIPDMYDTEVMQYVLQAHDIKEFVFSTLLPQIDPHISLAEQLTNDLRKEPLLLLAVIRRALWTNDTKVQNVLAQPAVVDRLLEGLEVQSFEDVEYWTGHRNHIQQLHTVAQRLLAKRSSELDDASFAKLFSVYKFDCQQLITAGIPETIAPQLALTMSSAAYKRLTAYAQLNPRLAAEDVKYACLRRPASPLQAIRVLEKGMGPAQLPRSIAPFQPNELKHMLSRRAMTVPEIRDLAVVTKKLTKQFADKLTPAEVRRICTTHEFKTEVLETTLNTKWQAVEYLMAQYAGYGSRAQQFRMRHVVFRAPLGTEKEALEDYLAHASLLHSE